MEINADLTIDEFEALKWALSEFRSNCTSFLSGDPENCGQIFDGLAEKVDVLNTEPYQAAIKHAAGISGPEEAETSPLLKRPMPWAMRKDGRKVGPEIWYVEDGSVLLEWIDKKWRFYVSVGPEHEDSSWGIVVKDGPFEHGSLDKRLWGVVMQLVEENQIKAKLAVETVAVAEYDGGYVTCPHCGSLFVNHGKE